MKMGNIAPEPGIEPTSVLTITSPRLPDITILPISMQILAWEVSADYYPRLP